MQPEEQLISRVWAGDREALAEFVGRHEALIRARFRERFAAGELSLYDSSDFFATVLRRFDGLLAFRAGGVTHNADALHQTLDRIMRDAAADYSRSVLAQRPSPESMAATVPVDAVGRGRSSATSGQERLGEILGLAGAAGLEPTDCEILRLRADGSRHQAIAGALGMSVAAVRMRWHRIAAKLRSTIEMRDG